MTSVGSARVEVLESRGVAYCQDVERFQNPEADFGAKIMKFFFSSNLSRIIPTPLLINLGVVWWSLRFSKPKFLRDFRLRMTSIALRSH